MERRFLMNDFEQSLKEHVDEFKMIPSKRVWHGIYNDMHPGRRWPSITMSLLLVSTLVIIGYLNTHTGSKTLKSKSVSIQSKNTDINRIGSGENSKINFQNSGKNVSSQTNLKTSTTPQSKSANLNPVTNVHNYSFADAGENVITDDLLAQNLKLAAPAVSAQFEKNNILFSEFVTTGWNEAARFTLPYYNKYKEEAITGRIAFNNLGSLVSDQQISVFNTNLKYEKPAGDINIGKIIADSKFDKGTKKIANKKLKKNTKISFVYFIGPKLNTVAFRGEPIKPLQNTVNSPAVAINQKNYKVLHNPALGFEGGFQTNFAFTKKLSFTSGLHITYSGYNIISNEVHPTFANLLLRDPSTGNVYSKSYITHYGDGMGQTRVSVRNYSLQASIPAGLQYEVIGNHKTQFNTYADFEPSMIIKNKAYILSSDGNNYVNDPDLLRKINMSSNFGLFVSFVSSKFKWQIGPNLRYQWLSTYKKDYSIQEHLIDYGIRIGISPLRK